jgi:hypothetical protein
LRCPQNSKVVGMHLRHPVIKIHCDDIASLDTWTKEAAGTSESR